ncbi:L7Ae/L30e/S12e/Gadd45 family ribosomal protein [Acutalibacter caecimuris]|uniref:L7Ae/L30e/S12e/Gadd45 family ribosomal protein n=1 Tax=Acutalibacter caecimuris TaxID=3093657 RepID=UPI002AC9D2D9|nr:ribosomal L7Ae/L30e/S12e/Gadd45 family protein [Acutalibacter sp. M00118]
MDKALSLLGLARRAGRLEAGFDACRKAARSGRAALLVAAGDISEKTYKNLCYEAHRAGIPALRLATPQALLGHACGVRAGVLAVNDQGFAAAVRKECEQAGCRPLREKEEESL